MLFKYDNCNINDISIYKIMLKGAKIDFPYIW